MNLPRSISNIALAAMFAFGANPALAGGTPAGSRIDNVATATFDAPGGPASIASNIVSVRVDELLGVVIASSDAGRVSAGVDTPYVAGSNDPVLAPYASVAVFLLSSICRRCPQTARTGRGGLRG